jgi:predicted DNA-binding transcriptional regulator YafY
MNRLERITTILLLLQTRKKITAQHLAAKFDTSVRTIYRDIRVLEEAGVPIGAEAGFGYYLLEGYSLPPILFSKDEAGAMLTAEKLLHQYGDLSLNAAYCSSMDKIRAVLKSRDKDYLEMLEDSISVHSKRPGINTDIFPNKYISAIQQALVNQQVIELEYYSKYNQQVNKRCIEPIGLSFINGTWHLFAWCRLRKAVRDFRPDRIKSLITLDETYNKKKLPSLAEVSELFFNPKQLIRIVLHLDKDIMHHIGDLRFYLGLQQETEKKNHLELIFLYPSLEEFARWILQWGNKIKIIEPVALKTEMKRLSKELYKHYEV